MNPVDAPKTPTAAATAPTAPTPPPVGTPAATPKLVVLRGMRVGAEYPIYQGRNVIGRFADRPVDIDLFAQEPLEQIWCSRRHAAITYENGVAVLEDLNSLNGTWVNGSRLPPGQKLALQPGDILQIGTVQLKFVAG